MKSDITIKEVKLKETKALGKTKKYIVRVEGTNESEYTFLEDTIIKHLIFKGKIYTYDEFEEILITEIKNNSLNLALNFIGYQFRSENELVNHLKEKQISTEIITSIISKLKTLGYIDDNKFSEYIVESYSRKLKGPNYCKKILIEKKVDYNIIDLAINSYTHQMEKDAIGKLIDKNIESLKKYPIKKQKMKLTSKLTSAGFRSRAINECLSNLVLTDESNDSLKKDLQKLLKKYDDLDENIKKQKIITSLMNKGYTYNQIKKTLNE